MTEHIVLYICKQLQAKENCYERENQYILYTMYYIISHHIEKFKCAKKTRKDMQKSEYLKKIQDEIVKDLENNTIPWEEPWQKCYNPVTGTVYSGFNAFYLSLVSRHNGWTDPRFYTYNELQTLSDQLKQEGKEGLSFTVTGNNAVAGIIGYNGNSNNYINAILCDSTITGTGSSIGIVSTGLSLKSNSLQSFKIGFE